ncbi:hypothetical protein [Fluviicola taffensis]|uniref:Uncharacterized protein n=1 Tax=Fluviicola taffensis (strain DSM 16823 / NCIMB 13979 / RW262) TaxID=755732 RepID=F2IH07_FLUTR|nr:hypothetical protein [Fluviicola taffensis]AEA45821.1 hypothetical protein Fluta_3855 [Fluviicola taffensis DSM 16823]
MKKVFVYILLPIFMFNSSIGELFKLSDLFVHFTEHKTINKQIDIFEFISMHYLGNDLNDNDQEKDMQLPFKKVSIHFSFQIASIPNFKLIPEKKIEVIDTYLQVLFKKNRPKDPALASLFRPPCQA